MHGNGEEYGSQKFELKKSSYFGKCFFLTCGASKCLGMHAQAITHPLLPFSSPILLHVCFLHATEVSCVLSFTFLLIFLIFACPEIRFGYYLASGQERFMFSCVFMDSLMAGHHFYLPE